MEYYKVRIMALRFKNRAKEPNLKKVLVYGMDGSGKSTFAEQYCRDNGLNPVCIDIDDTNYTNVPIVEINLTTDLTTYNSIKETIKEITKSEFDTIILDGVTSLLELLTSKAKGMAAYSDRSKRWNDILRALLISKKNLIFVGQIDMELIFTPDAQSSKAVIKVNSMVNEKYYCYIDEKGQYLHDVKKFRTLEQIEAESKVTKKEEPVRDDYPIREVAAQEAHLAQRKSKPSGFETAAKIEPTDENPVMENYVRTIAKRVALQGNKISKRTMRAKCFELVQMGDIPTEIKDEIYLYINENCPGEK